MVNELFSRFETRFIELIQHCVKLEDYSHANNDFDINLGEEELSYIADFIGK